MPPLRHRDLWVRAKDVWQRGRSRASWIKAHLEWPEAERRGFSQQAWLGNQHADELAGLGAAEHGLDQPTIDRVIDSAKQAKLMQSWFVRVLELLGDSPPAAPRAGRRQRMARLANPPRQQPRGEPGDHGPISTTTEGWKCGSCHRVVSFRSGWKEWKRVPCSRQSRRSTADVMAVLQTHQLRSDGDWLVCCKPGCGARIRRWERSRMLPCLVT